MSTEKIVQSFTCAVAVAVGVTHVQTPLSSHPSVTRSRCVCVCVRTSADVHKENWVNPGIYNQAGNLALNVTLS